MTRPSRWVIPEVGLAGSPPPVTPGGLATLLDANRPASASGRPCWEPGWETQTPVSPFLQSRITPALGRFVGEMHLFLVVSVEGRCHLEREPLGPGRVPPLGFRHSSPSAGASSSFTEVMLWAVVGAWRSLEQVDPR